MFSSLTALAGAMRAVGATKFYAKQLAPNDNSKNQVYLGDGFGALNIVPHGQIETDSGSQGGAVRDRAKASVDFYWITPGGVEHAPWTNLILYPKYPEVRLSGFLRGTTTAPNALMTSRDPDRVLIFGMCPDGRVLGHTVQSGSAIANEIAAAQLPMVGVFLQLTRYVAPPSADPKRILLGELGRIHRLGPIRGKRLYAPAPGVAKPYSAPNAGGYTLEAELGIMPNGTADPDFMGWEVKSFSVAAPGLMKAKSPTTLMTPEPTTGLYAQDFVEFMMQYGYDDTKGRPGRRNFGGTYSIGKAAHARTTLAMLLSGFDPKSGKISDLNAELALLDPAGNVAAGWRIKDIVEHWARKHAQAVYVPVYDAGKPKEYHYGAEVELGEGTDPIRFLKAMAGQQIYLDPGVKIENGKPKKRNQFRVRHVDLPSLYDHWSTAAVL